MPKSVLMCAPDYFDIEYEINPWMHTDNQVDSTRATEQWQALRAIYAELGWEVKAISPIEHLPDMVFTANGALVYDGKVALPHFRQPDRQPETKHFEEWFRSNGYTDMFKPKYDFEGEGDALVWNDIIFAGYPWRSDKPSHKELADFFGTKVVSLQLADARFYHLDTALMIVDYETVAIYPPAFTPESRAELHEIVPHVIEATHDDAYAYGLNAMCDIRDIVIPEGAKNLIEIYRKKGKSVHPTPIDEFQKSGGGVKCLTLELRS